MICRDPGWCLPQACNACSSAVLGLLVRIFSNGAILRRSGAAAEGEAEAEKEGEGEAESICRRLIDAVLRPGGQDVFYGLAGDSAGRLCRVDRHRLLGRGYPKHICMCVCV